MNAKKLLLLICLFVVVSNLYGQAFKTDCDSVNVYLINFPENGVNVVEFETVDFDDPLTYFNGFPDIASGLPSTSLIQTNSVGSITNDFTYGSSADLVELSGVIDTRGLGTIDLQDNNANRGEIIVPYVGRCCQNPIQFPTSVKTSTATGDGYGYITTLDPGIYFIGFQYSDETVNGGIRLQYAPTGTTDFVNFPAALTYVDKPIIECRREKECGLVLEEGESLKPLIICDDADPFIPVASGGGGFTEIDGSISNECNTSVNYNSVTGLFELTDPCGTQSTTIPVRVASNITPIPDNEVDANRRTGQAGTSIEYSRADHNHPIRRQAVPEIPVWNWILPGTTTLNATVAGYGVERTHEEGVYIRWRFQFNRSVGNGWLWANAPTIPGYQRPVVVDKSTYFATPPYRMGSEVAQWTSIPRIYVGNFINDATSDGNLFVTIVLHYIPN